jgi:hypothetical protein
MRAANDKFLALIRRPTRKRIAGTIVTRSRECRAIPVLYRWRLCTLQ